jgi:hypothetical protein
MNLAGDTPAATVRFGFAGDTRLLGFDGTRESTEENEGNEGFYAEDPNWIFVFFVAFCKNLCAMPAYASRRTKNQQKVTKVTKVLLNQLQPWFPSSPSVKNCSANSAGWNALSLGAP